jgi:hypothetical protein
LDVVGTQARGVKLPFRLRLVREPVVELGLSEEEINDIAEIAIADALGRPQPLDRAKVAQSIIAMLDAHGLKVVGK